MLPRLWKIAGSVTYWSTRILHKVRHGPERRPKNLDISTFEALELPMVALGAMLAILLTEIFLEAKSGWNPNETMQATKGQE